MKTMPSHIISLTSILVLCRRTQGFAIRDLPRAFVNVAAASQITDFGLSTTWSKHENFSHSAVVMGAKPKQGAVVDSYRTISVNCSKCGQRLFRYKKKNGTKSNLVKCYVERIVEDSAGVLDGQKYSDQAREESSAWECPSCNNEFARSAQIHGRPALKIIGGKIRMTKK